MQEEGGAPEWMARMGTEAVFRTLADFSVITSAGTGAILYERTQDEGGKLAEDLSALAIGRTLGVGLTAARRYLDGRRDEPERDPGRAAYVRAYRAGDEHIAASLAALSTNPDAPMSLGIYAASIALHRLRYTFFSAHLLYQLRLRFEADTVARQMLEQIAWAVVAAELDDDLAIDRLEPQKCIGRLKQLVPAAGPLYGLLSKSAHAGVGYHRAVFDVDEEDRGFIRHGMTDWVGSAMIMLTLADLWGIAHEHSQREHLSVISSTDPSNAFHPDSARPFRRRADELIHELRSIHPDE